MQVSKMKFKRRRRQQIPEGLGVRFSIVDREQNHVFFKVSVAVPRSCNCQGKLLLVDHVFSEAGHAEGGPGGGGIVFLPLSFPGSTLAPHLHCFPFLVSNTARHRCTLLLSLCEVQYRWAPQTIWHVRAAIIVAVVTFSSRSRPQV